MPEGGSSTVEYPPFWHQPVEKLQTAQLVLLQNQNDAFHFVTPAQLECKSNGVTFTLFYATKQRGFYV